MRFALIVNTAREGAVGLARQLTEWFAERGIDYLYDAESAEALGSRRVADIETLSGRCDVFVSLGGDGTLLFASHCSLSKPVIGINAGDLGFLTEFSREEMIPAVEKVMAGTYSIQTRSQLEASLEVENETVRLTALNDVVIEKGAFPRIPTFVISLDDEILGSYRADGIIIATSTGSTAYSLSAGGPIIAPKSKVFVITPICPHMLTVRPIVISDERLLSVSVEAPEGAFPLNIDGRLSRMLEPGRTVTVRKSPQVVNLVANENRSYCEILRKKLLWGHEHPAGQ